MRALDEHFTPVDAIDKETRRALRKRWGAYIWLMHKRWVRRYQGSHSRRLLGSYAKGRRSRIYVARHIAPPEGIWPKSWRTRQAFS